MAIPPPPACPHPTRSYLDEKKARYKSEHVRAMKAPIKAGAQERAATAALAVNGGGSQPVPVAYGLYRGFYKQFHAEVLDTKKELPFSHLSGTSGGFLAVATYSYSALPGHQVLDTGRETEPAKITKAAIENPPTPSCGQMGYVASQLGLGSGLCSVFFSAIPVLVGVFVSASVGVCARAVTCGKCVGGGCWPFANTVSSWFIAFFYNYFVGRIGAPKHDTPTGLGKNKYTASVDGVQAQIDALATDGVVVTQEDFNIPRGLAPTPLATFGMARPTGVSYRNFEAPFDKWSTEAKNEWLCKRDSPPTHGATAASIAKQHRDQSAGERVSPPVPRALARHPGQRLDTLPRVHDAVRLPVAVRTDIRFASIPPGQVLNVEYVHPPACLPCAPLSSGSRAVHRVVTRSKLSIEALMGGSGDFAPIPIPTIPALFCFDTFAQGYTTYTTPEEDGTKSLDYADGGVVDTPAVCGAVSQGATKISGKGPFVATEGEPCTWKVDPDSAYIQFVAQYFGQGPYRSGANDQCDDLFQSLMEQFQRKQEKGEALVAYLKDDVPVVENAFWGIDGGRCVANFAVILYTLPTNWARELKKHTKVDVFPMPQSRRKGGGADLTKPTWRKAGSFPYSGFAGNGPAIYYTPEEVNLYGYLGDWIVSSEWDNGLKDCCDLHPL
ncbi:hypothetical protein EMIHUDRAFT_436738 [Emiliania huxleyi CCMP1516]|uniref:PNPLA domain-containing protein n=2 Tax=Emiliania huxleyi TaxID=2903 RepID=A0A0D3IWT2_EMIH1|nr:hypothetical protein EMIHUDRAFT_436738 [Emiliania huxleyi CCMP1516]EOD15717.1 hypothetical protein EMIHUDRAFT_436738 [Emiliania huxleyi CCMP1516]|eukprot:XP_005768146.1 hypothetical protein EMIHUDRAFT_436738 [Emiliania huxleyi CCMP1516]